MDVSQFSYIKFYIHLVFYVELDDLTGLFNFKANNHSQFFLLSFYSVVFLLWDIRAAHHSGIPIRLICFLKELFDLFNSFIMPSMLVLLFSFIFNQTFPNFFKLREQLLYFWYFLHIHYLLSLNDWSFLFFRKWEISCMLSHWAIGWYHWFKNIYFSSHRNKIFIWFEKAWGVLYWINKGRMLLSFRCDNFGQLKIC